MLNYSRNIYAKAIFETFSKIKPDLLRVRMKKRCSWCEVFPVSFENLDTIHRDILVGLIEGGGYALADWKATPYFIKGNT